MNVSSKGKVLAIAVIAGLTAAAPISEAFARPNYYAQGHGYGRGGYRHYGHRGHGIGGAAVAGAALGVLGLAAGAAAANSYYNNGYDYGYAPSYGYAPAYGYGAYGYAPY